MEGKGEKTDAIQKNEKPDKDAKVDPYAEILK